MLKPIAPIDEEQGENEQKANDERRNRFPRNTSFEQLRHVFGGVFSGKNAECIADKFAQNKSR